MVLFLLNASECYHIMTKVMPKFILDKSAFMLDKGWVKEAEHCPSSHFTPRDANVTIDLLVIHNISLPPGEFGGSYISDLFLGCLDKNAHPYFADIYQLEVSAHCLIRRDGHVIQYVSFNDKAWHAGQSCYEGVDRCNDYSIGIELEGTDDIPYTEAQYNTLANITAAIQLAYPAIQNRITGHSDIAPGRKTDPGDAFDWAHFNNKINLTT